MGTLRELVLMAREAAPLVASVDERTKLRALTVTEVRVQAKLSVRIACRIGHVSEPICASCSDTSAFAHHLPASVHKEYTPITPPLTVEGVSTSLSSQGGPEAI